MWMACATSSLPVPVSPRSSTVDAVGATCSTLREHLAQRRRLADDVAEVELAVRVCWSGSRRTRRAARRGAGSRARRWKRSIACCSTPRTSFASHGLVM